jgi:hypothetical protein
VKIDLQNLNDEVHRRVVVVQQHHAVLLGVLDDGLRLLEDVARRARILIGHASTIPCRIVTGSGSREPTPPQRFHDL